LQIQDAAAPGRLFDITDYARDDLELITQVLGEGEVSGLAALPDGVVAQIAERMSAWREGEPSHTINFSLPPVSDVDMSFLQRILGDGPAPLFSRGYGACKITATGARNVWSVHFFNASDAIILDTPEIGDAPAAACAAEEDFRDSAERLREIHEAYFA
jgi:hydrogenase-1 operon protein HyaF